MPTLGDVYQKFGFAAEAAQLLETELGTLLFMAGALDLKLINNPDPERARELLSFINKQTLGQLLRSLHRTTDSLDALESQLFKALAERNRLFHSFYRQHNLRRNSDTGRALMLQDLESIHNTVLDAYKAVMLLGGVDLDKVAAGNLPSTHLPI
ncbi:MAG: hypothetical protein KGL98_10995 [Gammaproteobacteria bacterium]|nr:hypothetical protein [Gammaproteobacteria bacterium]MDE2461753.1 hypothetical protein [Gammaproteobacteria bacterium]